MTYRAGEGERVLGMRRTLWNGLGGITLEAAFFISLEGATPYAFFATGAGGASAFFFFWAAAGRGAGITHPSLD